MWLEGKPLDQSNLSFVSLKKNRCHLPKFHGPINHELSKISDRARQHMAETCPWMLYGLVFPLFLSLFLLPSSPSLPYVLPVFLFIFLCCISNWTSRKKILSDTKREHAWKVDCWEEQIRGEHALCFKDPYSEALWPCWTSKTSGKPSSSVGTWDSAEGHCSTASAPLTVRGAVLVRIENIFLSSSATMVVGFVFTFLSFKLHWQFCSCP